MPAPKLRCMAYEKPDAPLERQVLEQVGVLDDQPDNLAAVLDDVCSRDDAPPALKELDAQWFARTARVLRDEGGVG